MLKYLFYGFLILAAYSVFAYVQTMSKSSNANANSSAKIRTSRATIERKELFTSPSSSNEFFASGNDEEMEGLVKELGTMATRLTIISGQLASKTRQAAAAKDNDSDKKKEEDKKKSDDKDSKDNKDKDKDSKDKDKDSKDKDRDSKDKDNKEKEKEKEKDKENKKKDTYANYPVDEDSGRTRKSYSSKKNQKKRNNESDSEYSDVDNHEDYTDSEEYVDKSRDGHEAVGPKLQQEHFGNYDGVHSAKFDNYMLL
jgi:hypothetical protein